MPELPRDSSFDGTITLYRLGYRYIGERCRALGTDTFETRLLLRPTICMTGAEAARVFYDTEHMRRRGAMPARVCRTLIGHGGVQGLDGPGHRQRKDLLMGLMLPERIAQLTELARQEWRAALQRWRGRQRVTLLDEAHEVFCRAVCRWSGVPLPDDSHAVFRTADFAAMIDGAGALGPRYWRARLARLRGESWGQRLIQRARMGELEPERESALFAIARYRELDGELLEPAVAAVELLNVLRPTVAIGRFVTFAALALHRFPESRPSGYGSRDLLNFVNEVRRFFPFFPFASAIVGKPFEWHGCRFPWGRRVLLDLYGTDHDARLWDRPNEFHPERFEGGDIDAFALIPQGGGDPYVHHRCAGEWITIALLRDAVEFLHREARYRVPEQDLSVDLRRMPALPKSGFVIEALPPRNGGVRGQRPTSGASGTAQASQKPQL